MRKLLATSRIQLWMFALAAAIAALLAPAAAPAGAAHHRGRTHPAHIPPPVPFGFVGMNVNDPVVPDLDNHIDLPGQMNEMVASGVESIRVVFNWAHAQPYPPGTQVPADQASNFVDVGGVPTDWAEFDQIVGLASEHGLSVLPVVINAPWWDADPHSGVLATLPLHIRPYANFAAALVARYGPNGSFWHGYAPKIPIRSWQIWNEPNAQPAFWPIGPFARRYVAMLKAAHDAIKHVDRKARIVLAGLPNYSWIALQEIYAVRGARKLFDVVAIHPYTKYPNGVLLITSLVRQVMKKAGDGRKPIIAGEVSWPSDCLQMRHGVCTKEATIHNSGFDFATTERGQAANLDRVMRLLARNRVQLGLAGFYWYTWAGLERPNLLAFDFAGLFRLSSGQFIAKPAFAVFRRLALLMERCRVKGMLANQCLKPS